LLGAPRTANLLWPIVDQKNPEVYLTSGSSIGLIGVIPVPSRDLDHHALITYDAAGYVIETDWGQDAGINSWNGIALYAGDYGFFTGTNTVFLSKDKGGKADKAWVNYIVLSVFFASTNKADTDVYALEWLCKAAERGHPAALNELGNYFWEGSFDFDNDGKNELHSAGTDRLWSMFEKDNVKACGWYSIANENALPSWCRDILTVEEVMKVEHLLDDWPSGSCEREVLSKITDN